MKKLWILTLIPILMLSLWLPASAQADLLCDHTGLLSDAERAELEAALFAASDRNSFDIAVLLVDDFYERHIEGYAEGVYAIGGYGETRVYGGILLVLSMEERDWCFHVDQQGEHSVLTNGDLDDLENAILPLLKANDFYGAIEQYTEFCDDRITENRLNPPLRAVPPLEWYYIPIALGIGIIPAVIVVLVMVSKLKTVRMQPSAKSYLREDSLRVTERSEHFLYNRVVRIPRVKYSGGKRGGGFGGGSISRSGKF